MRFLFYFVWVPTYYVFSQERTTEKKVAVGNLLEVYDEIFASPVNSPFGLQAMARKIDSINKNNLPSNFVNHAIQLSKSLKILSVTAKSNNYIENMINFGISCINNGSIPNVNLSEAEINKKKFQVAFAEICSEISRLRLEAERNYGYNYNSKIRVLWQWQNGFFTDDYIIYNQNHMAWNNVKVRVAHRSGVSGTWKYSEVFHVKLVKPGSFMYLKNLFISSERCDRHIFTLIIKTSEGNFLKSYRCTSKTGAFEGLITGMVFYWYDDGLLYCENDEKFRCFNDF